MDDLTPWVVALIAALAPLLTVVLTERRPPELRRARWLGDEASRMREGTAERRLVEDARDDEIVGWVIARTGPGAGILFLIATYLWGVAAVLGIVAIIACPRRYRKPTTLLRRRHVRHRHHPDHHALGHPLRGRTGPEASSVTGGALRLGSSRARRRMAHAHRYRRGEPTHRSGLIFRDTVGTLPPNFSLIYER